ncbi:Dienelactone hydrolase endo-1,3,1,4-beta-D-glucanase [Mycena sanguinolenta]|uniref:Dienelactone hydrolase endo-1,3,1,4-beta-D-glucanase n=1 Tax=Mycena sanguinolenta TaxID=230812 RepID=A0A8H6YCB8_9AGAR|nr:Dienelactone hydrolase endo-1,3,1,4-beta-D-glucanase [Mycena sanguinolenta]
MSFCDDCFKGKFGQTEHIGGTKCYVATPTVEYPKDKVILLLTDGFGLSLENNLLLADDFARNGFKTIVPDMFNDDPVPIDAFPPNSPSTFDLPKWLSSHTRQHIRPAIDSVVAALKEQGVTAFGGTGYCIGARYVVDLAFDGVITVSVLSHPSFLVIPDDLEKYRDTAKAPLLINSCTIDQQFPLDAQAKADEILGGGKFASGYRREYFEGCTHGFAVRGDMSDPKVKVGKEGAFKACVEWFLKYL